MSENGNVPEQQLNVESTIKFDIARNTVSMTAMKVNGIAVLNPVPATITVDQWLEVAAKLILGRAQIKEQMQNNRVSKLL